MKIPLSSRKYALAFILSAFGLLTAPGQNSVNVQINLPGANVSSNLFGIFFEEISMAGDGGIYDEQVRNRGFEDTTSITSGASFWSLTTTGTATGAWSLDTSMPINAASNKQCLRLTMTGGVGTVNAINKGYFGIHITNGGTYNLGFYARGSNTFTGPLTARLQNTAGTLIYAQTNVITLTTNWQHFTYQLVPNATDTNAQLALSLALAGTVYLDVVSLFPAQTFNSRTNGLRPDLANLLVNLKPSFVRFPGGSWVDGSSLANAYHWESTIGDPGNRTPRTNLWGYMVDNGLGYHEYLQMCEDIGATPLFDINCGMDVNDNAIAATNLGPWIQEALDAIQYANGDTSTQWGAVRAANGHPAPFNLQYMEIGNENNGTSYNVNYGLFYNAIKSNYPNINLIGNSYGTIPTSAQVDFLDEHYYLSPAAFAADATKYDSYPRPGPKIFVGEYAVTSGETTGSLLGAIGEATFMTGLERNGDIVAMASYAPLFCNVNQQSWNPDLIYFNGTQTYGTASYYVQQMFSLNRGIQILPTTVNAATANTIFASSTFVPSSNLVIIKAVNFSSGGLSTTFNLNGVGSIASSGTLVQLTSANPTDVNSFNSPSFVSPVTNAIGYGSTSFTVTLPAYSLSIYKLQASGILAITNLQLTVATPLSVGQEAQAVLNGFQTGNPNPISLAGNYGVAYSSANTNVVIVTAGGIVIGAGLGTANIIASYNNLSVTQSVHVVAAPPTTLIHRYSFNDGTANDSIGSINGTFFNSSGNASIANGQLNLVGLAGDYVDFGPGVLNTTDLSSGAITFEAWASFSPTNGIWARLFDFGNISGGSGGNYIFLTANNAANGGIARLAVSATMPGANEADASLAGNFLGKTNLHIVAVFNPSPARQFLGVYTNGQLAASTSTGGRYLVSLNDQFSFLGHSLFSSDAWLNGSIDEFRIYNGELTKYQIAASLQAGPNATNLNIGTLSNFTLNPGPMPMAIYSSRAIAAYLNFTFASNVNVIGDSNLTLSSSNPNIFTVNSAGVVNALALGTANLTGVYDYISGNTTNVLSNTVAVTVYRDLPATLTHRYSFNDGTANDSVGTANGTLVGAASVTNSQLVIPNATSAAPAHDYLQLPAGIVTNDPACTVEAWTTINPGQYTWANLFDFGNRDGGGSAEYDIHLCVHASGGTTIAGISDSDNANADYQFINLGAASSLDGYTNLHVTVVFDPPAGYEAIYTNGVFAGANYGVTIQMSGVQDIRNLVGADNWPDPGMKGSIDELRIYNGVLHADEIAATQALGPNTLLSVVSPTISYFMSGGNLTLSWPLASAGFTLMSENVLSPGNWSAVYPGAQIVGNQWQVTVPVSGTAQYFRLQR